MFFLKVMLIGKIQNMQVKRACRHTTHRQTDGRHMKYKAAQDEDDVPSSPFTEVTSTVPGQWPKVVH